MAHCVVSVGAIFAFPDKIEPREPRRVCSFAIAAKLLPITPNVPTIGELLLLIKAAAAASALRNSERRASKSS